MGAFTGDTIFVIGDYVDDYWTYCEDDVAWADFYGKWSCRYTASATVNEAGSDFCGTSFTELEDGSLKLTCGMPLRAWRSSLVMFPRARG